MDLFSKKNVSSYIHPEPLWVKVFEFLRDAIVRGDIKPKDKLKESVIALKLGVSRSPVREAIRILESQNFIETIPQKGSFVKKISNKEMEEMGIVIKALLVTAVQLSTQNLFAENEKKLLHIVKDLEKASGTTDIDLVDKVSMRFHKFVVETCGNSLLIKINESLMFQQKRIRLLGVRMEPEDLADIIDEIIAICRSMLRSDIDEAEQLTKKYMDHQMVRRLKSISRDKYLSSTNTNRNG